eukprot:1145267-Pelagomonas_calceolata.AAC.1
MPMSTEASPAPRGPLLTPLRRILLAILWRSVTIMAHPNHCWVKTSKAIAALSRFFHMFTGDLKVVPGGVDNYMLAG